MFIRACHKKINSIIADTYDGSSILVLAYPEALYKQKLQQPLQLLSMLGDRSDITSKIYNRSILPAWDDNCFSGLRVPGIIMEMLFAHVCFILYFSLVKVGYTAEEGKSS